MPELIVIDNFYPDPRSIVSKAFEMEFVEPEDVTGWRTTYGYFPPGLKSLLKQKSGLKISSIDTPTGTPYDNGVFFHAFASGQKKDNPNVHWDEPTDEYICIVYLSDGISEIYGTSFYKHKRTGLTCAPTLNDARRLGMKLPELKKKILRDGCYKTRFIETDRVAYQFNRAIIFPTRRLHAATNHFGDALGNGRIYHLISFSLVA